MRKFDAEVLTIGDELNRGEIVDSNSSFLAERLTALGLHVRWRSSVTDDAPDMEEALRRAAGRARVVVCSGGLGPTDDDRTVDVVSAVAGVAAVEETAHRVKMTARFAERGFRLTPNNLRQIRIPEGAAVLANDKGLAPGFVVRIAGAEVACFPGIPREMKPMFGHYFEPQLRALVGEGPKTARRVWRVAGIGESHVDHALSGLLDGIGDATLHFRIAFPENLVTVVVRRDSQADADAVLGRIDADVRARLGDHLYGVDDDSLPKAVGAALVARGHTVAVAESCTGGLLGQLITSVAGSSGWFPGGVIAYSNGVKSSVVGVREETLAAHGAVSRETVVELADGVRKKLGATWGVAISGVAGPGGGTPDKPVGTVHIAVTSDGVCETRQLLWPGDREQIRIIAAFSALHLLWKSLTRAPA